MKKFFKYAGGISLLITIGTIIYNYVYSNYEMDVRVDNTSFNNVKGFGNENGISYNYHGVNYKQINVAKIKLSNTGTRDIRPESFSNQKFGFKIDKGNHILSLEPAGKYKKKLNQRDDKIHVLPQLIKVNQTLEFTLITTKPINNLNSFGHIYDLTEIDFVKNDTDFKQGVVIYKIKYPVIFSILLTVTILLVNLFYKLTAMYAIAEDEFEATKATAERLKKRYFDYVIYGSAMLNASWIAYFLFCQFNIIFIMIPVGFSIILFTILGFKTLNRVESEKQIANEQSNED